MGVSRRALLAVASAVGLGTGSGSASASESASPDDVALGYGVVPYAEQGYGGSASECFIATAAVGTSDHDDVAALRRFRDRYLLTNPIGRAAVRAYYRTSPPIARWIANGSRRRKVVRAALIRPASTLAQLTG